VSTARSARDVLGEDEPPVQGRLRLPSSALGQASELATTQIGGSSRVTNALSCRIERAPAIRDLVSGGLGVDP
jgi:hypothetical protein